MPAFSWCLFRSGFPATTRYAFVLCPVRATCSVHIMLLDLLTTVVHVEKYKSCGHLSLDIRYIKVFGHSSALRMPGVIYLLNCSFLQRDNCLVKRNVCAPFSLCLWHVFRYCIILYAKLIFFYCFIHIFIPETNSYHLCKEKLYD
jgi:hypothetical protein